MAKLSQAIATACETTARLVKEYFAPVTDAFTAHTGNKSNPHGVTAAQVGARDNTWLPTIAEIGAAPSGYGLGTYAQMLDNTRDLNNPLPTGLYRWSSSVPVNAPSPIGYAVMLHIARTDGDSIQKVWHLGTHSGVQLSCERYLSDNKGEWEWTNPPMQLGVEYRTTERWQGKPVYTMLVDVGVLPNNSTKMVMDFVTDAYDLVSAELKFGTTGGYPDFCGSVNDIEWWLEMYSDGIIRFHVRTTADRSGRTGHLLVKYTKS